MLWIVAPITDWWVGDYAHVASTNGMQVSVDRGQTKLEAPLDFAIVVAWRAIMGALLRQRVDADLLRLVHLSNSYRVLDKTAPLTEGDVCETSAEVTKMQVMLPAAWHHGNQSPDDWRISPLVVPTATIKPHT